MTNPLRFSMVISADASSAEKSVDDLRQDVVGLGQEARGAAGGLEAMSAGLDRSAQASGRASAALTAEAGAARAAFASANAGIDGSAAVAGKLGTQVRLTTGQVQNLGYQLNDVATMAAMGASPFAILSSQAGQVLQSLGDGPGGVRGSLAAIGSALAGFVRGMGPAGIALGGLAAAAGVFAMTVGSDVEPIEDVIDRQSEAVKRLREAYGLSGAAASDYAQRARQALGFAARQDYDDGLGRARGDVAALGAEVFGGRDNARRQTLESFEPLRAAYSELQRTAREGIPDFLAFRNVLTEIAETNPDDGFWTNPIGEVVREILAGIDPSVDFQVSLEAIRDTLGGMEGALARSSARLGEFNALAGELGGFIPDRMTDEQRIEQTFEQMMRLARTEAEVARAQDLRRQSLDALASAEANRRAGYELDYRSITARTAAERANIEAQRVRLELADNPRFAPEDVDRRANEVGTLAYTRAVAEFTDANLSRRQSLEESTRALQVEIETFGASEGAAAAYGTQIRELADYRRAAAEAGLPVDPAEEAAIMAAADALGAYTDRLVSMREAQAQQKRVGDFARGLDFDISNAGLPQLEQDISGSLDDLKLSADSTDGRQIAAGMRYLEQLDLYEERMEDLRDLNRDIWGGIADDILGGASALEAVDNALKSLASDLLARSMDQFADGIFGAISPMLGGKPERPAGLDLSGIAARGATPGSPMFVSVVGGMGGAAGGAVERLLNPANGNAPGAAVSGGSSSLVAGIRATAASLGISPQDLATVISYETGGTFDPTKRGPTTQWGQHRGLIQFGEPQARRYGVDWADPVGSQLGADGAIARYMRDAGVRPGHGLLDVYSAVNAGSVGRYSASDAMNGGAPGTVRDKVENQMAGHMQNAERLLGASMQTAEAAVGGVDQALNGTLVNGIGQIADQFLPGFGGVLENLLKGMGGGGGLIGALSGATGISAGATAHILANPGGGLWSGGGYTGDGGKFEPAGLVHRGEIVWNQDDVRRAGGVQVVEAMRLGLTGFAGGGVVGGASAGAAGTGFNVVIHDQRTSSDAEPIEARRSDDGRQVEMFVRDLARDEMTRPGRQGNRVLRQGYGMAAPRIER